MSLPAITNLIRLRAGGQPVAVPPAAPPEATSGPSLLAREERSARGTTRASAETTGCKTILLGMDLGTDRARIAAVLPGMEEFYLRRSVPSAVAHLRPEQENTVSAHLHFGDEALAKGPRFQVTRPWQKGDIADPAMARELTRHLRELLGRPTASLARAVVAVPITMGAEGRHHLHQTLRGLFDEVVFMPRPYLAGLGLRQQLVAQSTAADDPRPILFVDLGAGSTEACLIGENFPRPMDMAGLPFGGDHVESLIEKTLLQEYPGYHPTRAMLRAWKEEFGFVGEPQSKVVVKALMDGVERQVVLTQSLRCACEAWLEYVHELIASVLETIPDQGANSVRIFLGGGGSRLTNLIPALGELLAQSGLGNLPLQLADETDLSHAALGAISAARQIRADQWPRFAIA